MLPRQPHRSKSAPKSQSSKQPTHAWGEKRKPSKADIKERPLDDSLFKVSTENICEESKPSRKKSIKLSFRKKISSASKKESKSTSDLVTDKKKKTVQPLSLLLNPPDLVEDWYNVNDSPILSSKGVHFKHCSSVPKIELSVSSPNLQQLTQPEEDQPDTVETAVVPSIVALAAYPPSPYELSSSPKSFDSYLDEPTSPSIVGRSRSFVTNQGLPPSPLAVMPSTKVKGCEAREESEAVDNVRRQLSFGQRSCRQIHATSFPGPNSNHSVLNTSQSNFSFGRTQQQYNAEDDHKLTQYPGHKRVLMARVPLKGSPQASPRSSYHRSQRLRNSHSFTAQTSYSADALDSIDSNHGPKSSSMVCGHTPYVPRHTHTITGYAHSASGPASTLTGPAHSVFRFSSPSSSPSRYKVHRASYLNAVVNKVPLRRPSHITYLTSTPSHALNLNPASPSLSYIGVSPVTPSSYNMSSDVGSLVSLSPTDVSEFSIYDTQSEIGFGGRSRYYSSSGRAYSSCRGQRAYRSMILAKRHVLLSMFCVLMFCD